MPTVSPLHLWNPKYGLKTVHIFTEKILLVGGLGQFKLVLFKGQFYISVLWLWSFFYLIPLKILRGHFLRTLCKLKNSLH